MLLILNQTGFPVIYEQKLIESSQYCAIVLNDRLGKRICFVVYLRKDNLVWCRSRYLCLLQQDLILVD